MATDATLRDLAALQGAWEQVAFEENGVVEPPDEHGEPGALTHIEGERFTVRARDGRVLLRGRFELDATAMPRAITWIDAIGAERGLRLPASYELDGDDFVFIAADAGQPRPTVFRTTQGQTLRRFRRL
ncbi:MAG TPA: TIGR03067 domain-containing protein [Rhodanobacteraceae bacterium]